MLSDARVLSAILEHVMLGGFLTGLLLVGLLEALEILRGGPMRRRWVLIAAPAIAGLVFFFDHVLWNAPPAWSPWIGAALAILALALGGLAFVRWAR